MCNSIESDINTKSKKNTSNKQIDLDVIESYDNSTADNNAKKKFKKSEIGLNLSVEVENLKSELVIVKKALEDQQTMIRGLEDELKTKSQVLDKKELKILSLKQTIGK